MLPLRTSRVSNIRYKRDIHVEEKYVKKCSYSGHICTDTPQAIVLLIISGLVIGYLMMLYIYIL